MANQKEPEMSMRLSPRPAELIDRQESISFSFNGRRYQAYPGDTIASALAAAGVKVFSRSFKYHRPRGLLCGAGHCPNCLVQVGSEPNVRSCRRPVEPGMVVTSQNAWPSLERDVMSLTALGDRLLPVGFYYKAFIRPKALWPIFERLLRRAAGLGKVDPATPSGRADKQFVHTDLAVVGGGPAGLSAAVAAASAGARVALFEECPALGGHLRYGNAEDQATLAELLSATAKQPTLTLYRDATVLGWYEQNWLAAAQANRLYKVRAQGVIFATGAHEQPLVFDNNDLPGVMLAGAALRLINQYAVAPGQRALVVTANDDGWLAAAALQGAGIEVVALADERPAHDSAVVAGVPAAGATAYWGHTILAATGKGAVSGAIIAPVDDQGRLSLEASQEIACDLVLVCVGWTPANGLIYQAEARPGYDPERREFLPGDLPAGIYAAGRVTGAHALANELIQGRLVGRQAAADLGLGPAPTIEEHQASQAAVAAEPPRTSALVRVPGQKKQFVCYCEDVTGKDLEQAIAEGYDSIELLKRYSTISMGPCQGKMCSVNTIHLCARANNWTIAETGTTTSRPPLAPVSFGVLAGQNMEPVRLSPVHDWHIARGAKLMVAGLWLRPEHYGDPTAEVLAVRQAVGLIDVSTLGKFRLTGPRVPDFLDRMYVNKWQNLGLGRVRYGLMCTDEGIILDDGVTARVGEQEWYLTTTSSGAAAVYEWLQWWLQSGWGDGVQLTNLSEVNAAFNLAGPLARQMLQPLTDGDLSPEAFPYLGVREMTVAGVPCRLLRIGFTGELSYEIHCPAGYGLPLWEALVAAGEPFGLRPFGVEAQRVLRLEKGHLIVGHDTDALSDPLAADLAWLVKLDKADFLGRRSLTRIAQERPAQRLVGFKLARPGETPEEGLQIVRRQADGLLAISGWITSCRFSPILGEVIGLCWLPADLAEQAGAPFFIRRDGRLVEGRVHHGPFYDPDGVRLEMAAEK